MALLEVEFLVCEVPAFAGMTQWALLTMRGTLELAMAGRRHLMVFDMKDY